jgi:carbon storage regulator
LSLADFDPIRGERLLIGDEITVSIKQIHGLQVRIGVAAPKEIAVHRQEVFERIQVERRERAVRASPPSAIPAHVRHRRRLNQEK